MKATKTYLSGQSTFIVSCFVIVVTILTVYLTGENYNRTITTNFYISLSIIAAVLFLFMTYGLYKGVGVKDDWKYKEGDIISGQADLPDFPDLDGGDEFGGIFVAILFWIGITILLFLLLILLEIVFWISVFIILATLYWVFFRALKLVFHKSAKTKGQLGLSTLYAFGYTFLYVGWIYGIAFLTQVLR